MMSQRPRERLLGREEAEHERQRFIGKPHSTHQQP